MKIITIIATLVIALTSFSCENAKEDSTDSLLLGFLAGGGGSSASNCPAFNAIVKKTTTQNLANNANDQITFDTVTKDDKSMFQTSNSTFTIQSAGYYQIVLNLTWAGAAAGVARSNVRIDGGVEAFTVGGGKLDNTTTVDIGGTTMQYLAVGKAVTAYGWQNSGGTVGTGNGGKFSIAKICNF